MLTTAECFAKGVDPEGNPWCALAEGHDGECKESRPVTRFMTMLERDPEYDRSQPMSEQTRGMLRDVIARCERGRQAMTIDNMGRDPETDRYKHLQSKAEGVALAISYMEEELRLSVLSEGLGDGSHGSREEAPDEGATGQGEEAGDGER